MLCSLALVVKMYILWMYCLFFFFFLIKRSHISIQTLRFTMEMIEGRSWISNIQENGLYYSFIWVCESDWLGKYRMKMSYSKRKWKARIALQPLKDILNPLFFFFFFFPCFWGWIQSGFKVFLSDWKRS